MKMENNKYIELRVEGNEEDLGTFSLICSYINQCRLIGHCGVIKVVVDGDGSASLQIKDKNNNNELILSPDKDIVNKDIEVWIGE